MSVADWVNAMTAKESRSDEEQVGGRPETLCRCKTQTAGQRATSGGGDLVVICSLGLTAAFGAGVKEDLGFARNELHGWRY